MRLYVDSLEGHYLFWLWLVIAGFLRFIRYVRVANQLWYINKHQLVWYKLSYAPCPFNRELCLICNVSLLCCRSSLSQHDSVSTMLLVAIALGCTTVLGPGGYCNNIKIKVVVFGDFCTCKLYAYGEDDKYLSQPF